MNSFLIIGCIFIFFGICLFVNNLLIKRELKDMKNIIENIKNNEYNNSYNNDVETFSTSLCNNFKNLGNSFENLGKSFKK